jgi:hypothetical protein
MPPVRVLALALAALQLRGLASALVSAL